MCRLKLQGRAAAASRARTISHHLFVYTATHIVGSRAGFRGLAGRAAPRIMRAAGVSVDFRAGAGIHMVVARAL
ncbi:MAG TPA: hypothetical protein VEZ40_20435, partial [Pyrinomonadaceae bacterium]|nr:hypothetical protein [Pyrinomonadaceae bacterium]